jgi:integrase
MPKLTVASVQKYTAQPKRREIPDATARGLYLVIQPSGAKSWALRFRRPNGDPAKLTLGVVDLADKEPDDEPVLGGALTLGQARELAAQYDRRRARGVDIIEETKTDRSRKTAAAADRAANTFGSCLRGFFADYKTKKWGTRPRRWRDDAALLGLRYPLGADPATAEPSVIKGSLADIWRDKPVAEIDGHNVHTVVAEARKLSDGRARKLYAALSVLFGWLLQQRRGAVTANPCAGEYRPGPPQDRERVLSDNEISVFWRGCDAIGTPYGALFKLLLLTGTRLREAADMTRGELSEDGIWTIPGSRTKNHRSYALALPPLALKTINSVPVIAGAAGFVFTVAGARGVNSFSQAKRALDQAMAKIAGRPVAAWRTHDLRRTFVSGLAALGVQLPVIERCVNHVSGSFGGVAGVYQRHEFSEEKREALARWANHLVGLTAPKTDKVIRLPKRGGK